MYRKMIGEVLAVIGLLNINTRHVEAWMRLEHGTLDALSKTQFEREVKACAECAMAAPVESEGLALSFGL